MAKRKTPKKALKKKTGAKAAKKPRKSAPKKKVRAAKPAPNPAARTGQRRSPPRARKAVRRAHPAPRAVRPVKALARNPYDIDLDRNPANYQPLTPITFLERAAKVFPERVAIIHGSRGWTYADFYARTRRLASALARHGIKRGDTVAAMMTNTPGMIELHYGVPMTGGVLNTLNTRLDAAALAFMLDHGEAKVLITDREFAPTIKQTLALAKVKPFVIDYDDREFPQNGEMLGSIEYEEFLASGDPDF